ncbi:MAG TPA: PadR family transcriptional regulator [Mycobacteriales bacterium]|jgi:Predicted transcriptional regulators
MRALTPAALTVLRLLCEGPLHPYEMQGVIRRRGLDRMVRITHGSLYHTVDRLVEAGLIEPVETSRAGRRPERTVYAITEAGRDAAVDRLRQMLSTVAPEFPGYRAALAFLSLLTPAEASVQLGQRTVALQAELAGQQAAYDVLRKRGLPRVALLEIEHLLATTRAELDLTGAIVEDLDSGRLTWSAADGRSGLGDLGGPVAPDGPEGPGVPEGPGDQVTGGPWP